MPAWRHSVIENRNSKIENLLDQAADGLTNMAIDGYLLAQVEAGGPAVLRLYRWAPPTLSLGYFQSFTDAAAQADGLARLPVVRRVTGGGAIVHADELTYSLALPLDHPLASDRPEGLYAWMHTRIAEAVARLGGQASIQGGAAAMRPGFAPLRPGKRGGPFLCFAAHARFDLMSGPDKLAGSAQRRTRRGLLQHGSVVLNRTHPVQPSAAVSLAVGRPVGFEEFADALLAAVGQAGVELSRPRPSRIPPAELQARRDLYAAESWLRRR